MFDKRSSVQYSVHWLFSWKVKISRKDLSNFNWSHNGDILIKLKPFGRTTVLAWSRRTIKWQNIVAQIGQIIVILYHKTLHIKQWNYTAKFHPWKLTFYLANYILKMTVYKQKNPFVEDKKLDLPQKKEVFNLQELACSLPAACCHKTCSDWSIFPPFSQSGPVLEEKVNQLTTNLQAQ